MPSAEEILKARDSDAAPPVEEKIATDYAEEKPAIEHDEGDKPAPPPREPDSDDDGDDDKGPVPYQALKAERQKAKRYTEEVADLRRQLSDLTNAVLQQRQQPQQQPRQPEPPPEFDWDNPHTTIDQRIEAKVAQERAAIQAEFQRQREAVQSQFAITRHGEDVVKAAYHALQAARETDPNWGADYTRIMRSPDQYEAMVQWHKRQSVLHEVGTDPEAYKAKIRAEYLEELRTGRVTDEPRDEQSRAKPASVMPSNLSAARSVGSRNGAAWSGPASIKDILGSR